MVDIDAHYSFVLQQSEDEFFRRTTIDETRLRAVLRDFKSDDISEDDVISRLIDLPFEDLDFAKVDHHRALRKGFPEVIFGQGKMPAHIASISEALLQRSDRLLVTRASPEAFDAVYKKIPNACYEEMARCIVVDNRPQSERKQTPGVLVVCAGTADLPVASEAVVTAEMMGCEVERVFDVGACGRDVSRLEIAARRRGVLVRGRR